MKKIILSAVAMFAFGVASAQIKTDAGTFGKPVAGTVIMEANFSPNVTGTAGGGIFSLQNINPAGLLGVKVRKFSSDKTAMRYSANLDVQNSSAKDAAGEKLDTQFKVGFGIGVEHHMTGAERLSTYWGYEGSLAYLSTNGAGDKNDTKIGVGASVLTGFDYYIMPKIYLGAEVSYGLGVVNSQSGVSGSDSVTEITLSPSITPSFRLGWQF